MEPTAKTGDHALVRPTGRPQHPLILQLADNPQGFDFFQVVRVLEALRPFASRVGRSVSPKDEAVRMEQAASMGFPTTDIADLTFEAELDRWKLTLHAFGLLGPHGPLPNVVTDYILSRLARHETLALLRFINLFNHRLMGLYYCAWAAANKAVDFDRALAQRLPVNRETGPAGPRFPGFLACLSGGQPDGSTRDPGVEHALLFFSGHFSTPAPNVEGLKNILESFFEVEVAIEAFSPRWFDIPEGACWRMGASRFNGLLGVNTVLGTRVMDYQTTFRIVLGPLDKSDYDRLLPPGAMESTGEGESFQRLCALVKRYTRDQFYWDIQYVLRGLVLPDLKLDGQRRLGFDTWLRSEKRPEPAFDFIVNPDALGRPTSLNQGTPSTAYAGN